MAEKWWSRKLCPKCGILMTIQHWGDNAFRLSCEECGHSEPSSFSNGVGDSHGQGIS